MIMKLKRDLGGLRRGEKRTPQASERRTKNRITRMAEK